IAFDPSGKYLMVTNWWMDQALLVNVALGAPELRFSKSEIAGETSSREETIGDWYWCRGALDTPHRIMPLEPEDGLTGDMAVHPGGRLMVTMTSLGIVLTDIATCQRLQFLPYGYGRWPRFDAEGNFYAPSPLGGTIQSTYRWPISVKDNRY